MTKLLLTKKHLQKERGTKIYFTTFESFTAATEHSKAFHIEVEKVGGGSEASSIIPIAGLEDALEELTAVEGGAPAHLWKSVSKELIVIPHSQVKSIRLLFQ
jgi:hypothetical protein